jgi:hypothetical protein
MKKGTVTYRRQPFVVLEKKDLASIKKYTPAFILTMDILP